MASASKASLVVSASVAAEALKDQLGLWWWNYALRSLHQRVRPPFSRATRVSSAGEGAAERAERTEAPLSKLVYWDCWGPNRVACTHA
ncbi:hypothetical protein MUK42_24454 [Musa troglodytarum]|uniref:Wound induced protein n=1 Tax=Musa troglodytarum TaxID=320322 RepID=A0A9E7KCM3_9LILI|nr:hypothetical protein MUK42_24454 [Musa troglodytarum]